ncbi:MAG: hypothetical protein ACOVT5_07440 [Armatimonadaceae bacterium]
MRLIWETDDCSCEFADDAEVRAVLRSVFEAVPREHLRQLDAVAVMDHDPKGRNLGLYTRDHRGPRVEIYLHPHFLDALRGPASARIWTFHLHVAHTLFHEVGHHVTWTINRRAAPTRKRPDVTRTMEKWAEEYTAKRLEKYRARWVNDPALDDINRASFLVATAWVDRLAAIARGENDEPLLPPKSSASSA